ncbi:MAG: xanthine dehydrogenase family protein molybdopterin-binding subunit [Gemmatimonadota bacterium]
MNTPDSSDRGLTRREVIRVGALGAGGLLLAFVLPARTSRRLGAQSADPKQNAADFEPNAWLRIAPDGTVTVLIDRSEMGQGVLTSLPMLVAEELDADWSRVRAEHLPVDARRPIGRAVRLTGGSASVRQGWTPARQAGAVARAMLVAAAAERWGVAAAECTTGQGVVMHERSGRREAYGALVDAAAGRTPPTDVPLKDPKDFRIVGTRQPRLDTPAKVDGSAVFGIDVRVPGMLTAVVARCGACGGTPRRVDDARARAVPGVRHVVRMDHGVAVVADGYWPAHKGREALTIQWQEPADRASSTDVARRLTELAARPAAQGFARGEADVKGARMLEATYTLPFLAHATMEPMNCTAHVTADGVTLWAPTQFQSEAVRTAAEAAGVPPERVVVHTTLMGGGFGRRGESDFVGDAVRISKAVGAPVQVVYSREDDMRHDFYRPASVHALRGGVDADGWPTLLRHRVAGHVSGMRRFFPQAIQNGIDPDHVAGLGADLPYAIPNHRVEYAQLDTSVPTGFWRSVGHSGTAFAVECFIDELAVLGGKDPLEVRRHLLATNPRALGVLNLAAEKAGWGHPLPAGRAQGIALVVGFGSYMAEVAEVSMERGQPRVHRVVCAIDCGRVVNPSIIEAQVQGGVLYGLSAALHGDIAVEGGKVKQGNFHDYRVMRMHDSPVVETHIVPSTARPGGVGEPPTPPVAPAVANASFRLTGQRVRRLPFVRAAQSG